ncbi:MAG: VWA domain-containing protein [Gemmatimonadaceae bacterium]|nr:VWA domain-containing protein [Gemmatimonadaceae bacterium]NUO93290.1 VWA domain-containing protein [Gemmatimonadaceae bacterium]NUS34595.1 VWA domain-containing protein [Gemmatimonadaceae bacterium]
MIQLGALQLAQPLWLLLLLLLPVWWLLARRRRPAAIVFSRVPVLARGPRAGRTVTKILAILRNLALLCGIVALARPRSGARAETSTSEGINMVIAFDISSSMLAMDFQPQNRLEVARAKIKQFVQTRSSDRIGIVAFSGEALTQVPLTTDYPVVQQALDNLQPGQLEDGTAIGTAIATAANRLKDAPGKSRVLIILTDGVNNRGAIDPRTAAKAAAQFGIKIYGIGVGTEGMAPVPVGRGLFGLRYEMQKVEIDDALLTDISTSTGGRYFRARDPAALQSITEQINALERTPVRSRTYVRYSELFRWPLGAMLALLAAELLLLSWKGPLP